MYRKLHEGTYLATIPEQSLFEEVERYRDACPFRVELAYHGDIPVIRITLGDGALDVYYKEWFTNQIRILLDAIDTGPEGVYFWTVTMHFTTDPPPSGYKPTNYGKWLKIRDYSSDKTIVVLPWCPELREALIAVAQ